MSRSRILGWTSWTVGLCFLAIASVAVAAPPEVPPSQVAGLVSAPNGPLLLDVRTPDEFAQGHIPGALLIPVDELSDRLHQIAAYKERGVVAYCESGVRARRAIEILERAGFKNLKIVSGSMKAWRAEKHETER